MVACWSGPASASALRARGGRGGGGGARAAPPAGRLLTKGAPPRPGGPGAGAPLAAGLAAAVAGAPRLRARGRRRAPAAARGAAAGGATSSPHVRVVTYNLLSPTLCDEDRFPHCLKEDLDSEVRWGRVAAKLEESMSSAWPTVVCLQEVDEAWMSRLHVFFQRRGWHFAPTMTPPPYWKFEPIGVALAWPSGELELEEMEVVSLGTRVQQRLPQAGRPPWWRARAAAAARRTADLLRWACRRPPYRPPPEPWALAARRRNRMLAARLRGPSGAFAVVTYHMPCLFGEPAKRQAKAIHAAVLRREALRFAGGGELVVAGDFNTKPLDSELGLVHAGALPDDAARPPPLLGLGLEDLLPPEGGGGLRSAYAAALGREPEFTNYAWIKGEPGPFRDTLDYIFVSGGVEVVAARELPAAEPSEPVYPSAREPSDHLLLYADIRLPERSP